MFEERRFPIFSFIPTLLFIMFGGWIATKENMGGVGAILIGVAILIGIGQIVVAVLKEYREVLHEQTFLQEASADFYKTVRSLTEEEKTIMGLARMPKQTRLVVEERSQNSSYTSEVILSISPVKTKALCQALAQGVPFSIRKIAGPGKVLSDGEFRLVSKELVAAQFLIYNDPEHPEQGYSLTPAGQQWIEDQIGL